MIRTITSEEAMKRLGLSIGKSLKGGECIELIGDIGAGKTTLTKGIAKGLNIVETVQSPTFTINRTYESPTGITLSHYDFYRLSDPGIMADEISESLSDPSTSIVIEWGDIIASVLPADRLTVKINSPDETVRTMQFKAQGEKSIALVESIK